MKALVAEESICRVTQDKDGKTALMLAAENGHIDVVNALLYGVDIEEDDKAALILAAKNGHTEVVKALLEAVLMST